MCVGESRQEGWASLPAGREHGYPVSLGSCALTTLCHGNSMHQTDFVQAVHRFHLIYFSFTGTVGVVDGKGLEALQLRRPGFESHLNNLLDG